ncbi:MAG: FAD-binding protein [Pseudomonadota bacterium]
MSVLVIAEHDNETISPSTLNTIAAAKEIDGDVAVFLAGSGIEGAVKEAAAFECVSKVIGADAAELEHQVAENVAPIIVDLAGSYSHTLAPASTFGKNLMPRVAALLDTQQISDIIKVVDADTFVRPVYAGNAIATVKSSDEKKIITVRTTAFDPVAKEGGSAANENIDSQGDQGLSKFQSAELSESERPELTAAGIVVSGGRGVGSAEDFAIIEKLTDKLGGALGASRAAVDAGYISNDHQVGQTGKVVAPELYIAIGISGAIQHLAGMKDSKVIVAINKDEEAPIFSVADYGLVADLFEAVPELEGKL